MDLTNIKPCVECKKYWECAAKYQKSLTTAVGAMSAVRSCKLLVLGDDCFEEGDNNA